MNGRLQLGYGEYHDIDLYAFIRWCRVFRIQPPHGSRHMIGRPHQPPRAQDHKSQQRVFVVNIERWSGTIDATAIP